MYMLDISLITSPNTRILWVWDNGLHHMIKTTAPLMENADLI